MTFNSTPEILAGKTRINMLGEKERQCRISTSFLLLFCIPVTVCQTWYFIICTTYQKVFCTNVSIWVTSLWFEVALVMGKFERLFACIALKKSVYVWFFNWMSISFFFKHKGLMLN